MKFIFSLILLIPCLLSTEEIIYEKGNVFESKKSHSIVLYEYKADATRVNLARLHSYSIKEFMDFGSVDVRDIYKVRRGDTLTLSESYRDGEIFKVELKSGSTKREKYFILSDDLEDSSLVKLEVKT